MTSIRIGMPAGSLADPKRGGNLVEILERAGFPTSGYDQGGPTRFSTIAAFLGWDGRPQEFGAQLGLDEIDVAIGGDDWIRERQIELELEYQRPITLEKVLPLGGRGGVRIVGILREDHPASDPIAFLKTHFATQSRLCVATEMPYLALDWVRRHLTTAGLAGFADSWRVQKYGTPPKIDHGVVIYETWGKTEAKVKNQGAHCGVEITQSGSALKGYGLKIIDTVMTSEAGIWINPVLRKEPSKVELVRMFLLNLYGAINAENKVLLIFNVENSKAPAVEQYLTQHRLFGDEPTVNRGPSFTEYSVQVETANAALPLARVRYDLTLRGAKNLDTIPVRSAIPGIEVLKV